MPYRSIPENVFRDRLRTSMLSMHTLFHPRISESVIPTRTFCYLGAREPRHAQLRELNASLRAPPFRHVRNCESDRSLRHPSSGELGKPDYKISILFLCPLSASKGSYLALCNTCMWNVGARARYAPTCSLTTNDYLLTTHHSKLPLTSLSGSVIHPSRPALRAGC